MADILNQQYNITSLFLQGGYLDLILEKDGTINLLKAKSTPDAVVNTEAKTDTVSSVSVNLNKDKKIAFMNLKVTGTPEGNFEVGLGKQPKKKRPFE